MPSFTELERIPPALRKVLLPQSLKGRIKVECFALQPIAENDHTLQALSGARDSLLGGAARVAGAVGLSERPPQPAAVHTGQSAPALAASTDPERSAAPPAPAILPPAIPGLPGDLQKPAGDILRGLLDSQQ